jgi:FkbM family methyltransferase
MKVTYSEHTYFAEKISRDPVLIDLGGCLGDFSKHFIERYPNAKIIILEPSKTNFLNINLEGDNITKIFGALFIRSGEEVTFYEDPKSPQNGSLLFNYFQNIAYKIKTYSLDDIVKDIPKIDLIKMDVEGAEWDCLMNTTIETLNKIEQISVEFHDFLNPSLANKSQQVVDRLLNIGFKIDYNPTNYMYGSKFYDSLFYR